MNLTATGAVSLDAGASADGNVTIIADSDADGDRRFFRCGLPSTFINSNSIQITANDISLSGSVDSGTADVQISDSDSAGIGLGSALPTAGLTIDGAELTNISSTGATFSSSGQIAVDGITAAHSNSMAGTVVLTSTQSITFETASSTFNALNRTPTRTMESLSTSTSRPTQVIFVEW